MFLEPSKAYIFHFSTTESCFAATNSTINSTVTNLTVFDIEIASEPLTSDDLEYQCHTMTCTVVSLSVYTAALLTAVFGFEGSPLTILQLQLIYFKQLSNKEAIMFIIKV